MAARLGCCHLTRLSSGQMAAEPVDDVLPTAVRVWAVRTSTDDRERDAQSPEDDQRPLRRYPAEALVFDTETRDEAGQRLLVGVWRFYRDAADTGRAGRTCIEEGLFFPDDLP